MSVSDMYCFCRHAHPLPLPQDHEPEWIEQQQKQQCLHQLAKKEYETEPQDEYFLELQAIEQITYCEYPTQVPQKQHCLPLNSRENQCTLEAIMSYFCLSDADDSLWQATFP